MESIFRVDPELNIPIYRQMVDSIRMAVRKEQLKPGQQLPTVQELSEKLGVARGTVKRAYDELEHCGLVEKAQGRGTFISMRQENTGSRKEQAMAAIDKLLEELTRQDFSPAEIGIFLDLKLRSLAEQEAKVKVGVLECNPEALHYMTEQLRSIPQVDLYSYLTEQIERYPYELREDLDLVVTTAAHGEFLQSILPASARTAKVALRLSSDCLSQIIKLRRGKRAGILCYSARFGALLHSTCVRYTDSVELPEPLRFDQIEDMAAYLETVDTVLLPRDYKKYCTAQAARELELHREKLILCSYEMDEGSFIYLQEKCKRLLEEKSL